MIGFGTSQAGAVHHLLLCAVILFKLSLWCFVASLQAFCMQHLVQLTVMERCANQWHLNLGCTAAFDTLFCSNLSEACTAGITNALLHMILKVVLLWW